MCLRSERAVEGCGTRVGGLCAISKWGAPTNDAEQCWKILMEEAWSDTCGAICHCICNSAPLLEIFKASSSTRLAIGHDHSLPPPIALSDLSLAGCPRTTSWAFIRLVHWRTSYFLDPIMLTRYSSGFAVIRRLQAQELWRLALLHCWLISRRGTRERVILLCGMLVIGLRVSVWLTRNLFPRQSCTWGYSTMCVSRGESCR